MEDLWKISDIRHRLSDTAERAEYQRLVRRFREEEQTSRQKDLLFDQIPLHAKRQPENTGKS